MTPRRTRSGRVFGAVDPSRQEELRVVPAPRAAPLENRRTPVSAARGAANNEQENVVPQSSFTTWTLPPYAIPGDRDNLFAMSVENFGPENPARIVVLNNEAFDNIQAASTTTGVRFRQPSFLSDYPHIHFHGTVLRTFTNQVPQQPAAAATSFSLNVKCPGQEELTHDSLAAPDASTCIICLENAPICMAYPCNHLSYCVTCARALSLEAGRPKRYGNVPCPKCRTLVKSFERCVFE